MEWKHLWLSSAGLIAGIAMVAGCASNDREAADNKAEQDEAPLSFFPDDLMAKSQTGTQQPGSDSGANQDFPKAKWEENARLALSKAEALDRPLLVLFTAMTWQENSRHLSKEVFGTRTFNAFARENLVLTFLDFPQSATDAPDGYRNFKDHYDVPGYPTLILIDPKSKTDFFRKVGYTKGKARDYFTEVRAAALSFRGKPVTDWQVEGPQAGTEEADSIQ